MELTGVEIIFMHRSRVGQDIVCCCYGLFADGYIVLVYEIDIGTVAQVRHQRRLKVVQLIPSHAGHFIFMLLGLKSQNLSIKDANAVRISFLRMLA
jgi:hypothetical protein